MKRFFAVLLTMVLTFTIAAVAEETPSKTVDDIAQVVDVQVVGDEDAEAGNGILVEIDDQIQDYTPMAEEYQQIAASVNEGMPPIEHFPDVVKEAVKAKLPEGVDAASLQFNEAVAVRVEGQLNAEQTLDVWTDLVTPFQPGQTIVAILGLYDGTKDETGANRVEWIVLDVEIRQYSDGQWYPVVTLSAEVIEKIKAADTAAFYFLNTAA